MSEVNAKIGREKDQVLGGDGKKDKHERGKHLDSRKTKHWMGAQG